MSDLRRRVQDLFLTESNEFGCAETALVALRRHFSLPDSDDSSPAMALNGGIGYSGGTCGAITGCAIAAGLLAGRALPDHAQAKREARHLAQSLMAAFAREFGSMDCRTLTGYDFTEPGQHRAFIDSGVWRVGCLRQIEYSVDHIRQLVEATPWKAETATGVSGQEDRSVPRSGATAE